jgi:hypothetical protein
MFIVTAMATLELAEQPSCTSVHLRVTLLCNVEFLGVCSISYSMLHRSSSAVREVGWMLCASFVLAVGK